MYLGVYETESAERDLTFWNELLHIPRPEDTILHQRYSIRTAGAYSCLCNICFGVWHLYLSNWQVFTHHRTVINLNRRRHFLRPQIYHRYPGLPAHGRQVHGSDSCASRTFKILLWSNYLRLNLQSRFPCLVDWVQCRKSLSTFLSATPVNALSRQEVVSC